MPAANPRHSAHLERPDALERESFTISDLSAEFGVTARALRFYEDEGLIAPTRSACAIYRNAPGSARMVMRAKNVGFSPANPEISPIHPATAATNTAANHRPLHRDRSPHAGGAPRIESAIRELPISSRARIRQSTSSHEQLPRSNPCRL